MGLLSSKQGHKAAANSNPRIVRRNDETSFSGNKYELSGICKGVSTFRCCIRLATMVEGLWVSQQISSAHNDNENHRFRVTISPSCG